VAVAYVVYTKLSVGNAMPLDIAATSVDDSEDGFLFDVA
jgi:hypothetical protein